MRTVTPIILIILALGIFFGYTNPLYQKIKDKQLQQSTIVEANKKAAQLRAVRDSLSQERNKISDAEVENLKKMLPDAVDSVGLIIDMQNLALSRGVVLKGPHVDEGGSTNATQGLGPDSSKYGTISMSFVVTNSYENFLVFLKDLESSLRLLDVTSVGFSSNKDGQYDYTVTLQTYWLK